MSNEFTLHIALDSIQTDKSKAERHLKNTTSDSGDSDPGDENTSKLRSIVAIAATEDIAKKAYHMVQEVGSAQISKMGAIYDNQMRQAQLSNLMTSIGMGAELVGAGLSGAKIGSAAGGVGAAIGAVAAVAADAAKQAYQAYNRYESWDVNQYAHGLDETRASERLGIQRSNRSR